MGSRDSSRAWAKHRGFAPGGSRTTIPRGREEGRCQTYVLTMLGIVVPAWAPLLGNPVKIQPTLFADWETEAQRPEGVLI